MPFNGRTIGFHSEDGCLIHLTHTILPGQIVVGPDGRLAIVLAAYVRFKNDGDYEYHLVLNEDKIWWSREEEDELSPL